MPKLTIDGKIVEVPPRTNLVEAGKKVNVVVPIYCYHPALSVVASCRMCQVELHAPNQPVRLVAACRTEALEGMQISTSGPDATRARAAVLEFLLANHPLDCPICDKAGECDLQDYSFLYGSGQGRFEEKKREGVKHELIGNHILLDQERCIMCTRCVRFMDEYAKSPSLLVKGRGDQSVIATFPGEKIQSNYEGNLSDICPVGALTSKEFRFKSRVWDLCSSDSVCTLCDRLCTVRLEVKRGRLFRVRPIENPQVNGWFMCDRGRFGLLDHCNPGERATRAFAGASSVGTETAILALATKLRELRQELICVLSARLSCEEILLARRAFAPFVRPEGLLFLPAVEEGGDGILYTGRQAANEAGLKLLGIRPATDSELRAVLSTGGPSAAVFFDHKDAERAQARASCAFLALIDVVPRNLPEAPLHADVFVPGLLFSEKEGTMINCSAILERLRRAQPAPEGVAGERSVLERLGDLLKADRTEIEGPDLTSAVTRALGLPQRTLAQIPRLGLKVPSSAPALETARR